MKNQQASVPSVSVDSLEKQALSLTNSGKYIDAIALYKKFLHDADDNELHKLNRQFPALAGLLGLLMIMISL